MDSAPVAAAAADWSDSILLFGPQPEDHPSRSPKGLIRWIRVDAAEPPPEPRYRKRRKGLAIVPAGLRRRRPDAGQLLAIHNRCLAIGDQIARGTRFAARASTRARAVRRAPLPVVA